MTIMMMLDLPIELLPVILQHIFNPHFLAAACLVNRTFNTFAIPKLYQYIAIFPWHRESKAKVIQLFTTLSCYPYLAKYVQTLELREFPKTFTAHSDDLRRVVVEGLKNCVNLRHCIWTRDGSLTSPILQALHECPKLRGLEINGHDGNYDPSLLLRFTTLHKISLIMPSAAVISALSPWIDITGASLRSLNLICKASPIVTDTILSSLAPNLIELDGLHIAGCPKVTHEGIWALLSTNTTGIVGLGLEGLSPKFNMTEFAFRCSRSVALSRLRSINLTVNQQTPLREWTADVSNLLWATPLEKFQIYSTGAFFEASTTNDFWLQVVNRHGARLTRFSVHRMLISPEAIKDICRRCVVLEELFVTVDQDNLKHLGPCLSPARRLRTLHIDYPLDVHSEDQHFFSLADALTTVMHCSASMTHFGCNARVWQINRTVHRNSVGQVITQPHLTPYEGPAIPEQFLVVRA